MWVPVVEKLATSRYNTLIVKSTAGDTPEVRSTTIANFYHVFAQRRSGHHAVMQWLMHGLENAGANIGFENDIVRSGRDVGSVLGSMSMARTAVFNYEDVSYRQRHLVMPYLEAHSHTPDAQHHNVLIGRDWYNLVASRLYKIVDSLRKGEYVPIRDVAWSDVRRQWIDIANIGVDGQGEGEAFINFNKWFVDPEYRTSVAACLDLVEPDELINEVALIGRGSSFDGVYYQGRAQSMNVLRRWEGLSEPILPVYRGLITDQEISELNTQLFGFGQDVVLETLPA